jgi:hypothetical protein
VREEILPSEYQLRCIPTQQQHTEPPGNRFCTEELPTGQYKKEINKHLKPYVQKKRTNYSNMIHRINAHNSGY